MAPPILDHLQFLSFYPTTMSQQIPLAKLYPEFTTSPSPQTPPWTKLPSPFSWITSIVLWLLFCSPQCFTASPLPLTTLCLNTHTVYLSHRRQRELLKHKSNHVMSPTQNPALALLSLTVSVLMLPLMACVLCLCLSPSPLSLAHSAPAILDSLLLLWIH